MNFFPRVGVGLNEDKQKIKKITIPVQIILCFSAKNINSKLIQVISFFNIVDYYFMKKKISFIFIHLICCAHFAGACISVPIQLWPPWPFIHYIQQKGSFNLSHFNYVLLLRSWKEYWYDSHTNPWFIPIVVYILKLLCKEQTITRRKIKKDLYSFSDLFFFFTKGEEYGWLGALNCFHLVVKYLAPTDKSEMAKK